jgi:hypothetical protein
MPHRGAHRHHRPQVVTTPPRETSAHRGGSLVARRERPTRLALTSFSETSRRTGAHTPSAHRDYRGCRRAWGLRVRPGPRPARPAAAAFPSRSPPPRHPCAQPKRPSRRLPHFRSSDPQCACPCPAGLVAVCWSGAAAGAVHIFEVAVFGDSPRRCRPGLRSASRRDGP